MISKMLKSRFVRAMELALKQKLPGLLIVIWLIIISTGREEAVFILFIYLFLKQVNMCVLGCYCD